MIFASRTRTSLTLLGFLLLAGLGFSAFPNGAQEPFLTGTVEWEDGGPAIGVEVELFADGLQRDSAYVNAEGEFVLDEVEGTPTACELVLWNEEGSELGRRQLTDVTPGQDVGTITVTRPE